MLTFKLFFFNNTRAAVIWSFISFKFKHLSYNVTKQKDQNIQCETERCDDISSKERACCNELTKIVFMYFIFP